MINQTRITVDEATRKVLDDLSEHLSRPPSWVASFKDEMQEEVRDVIRDAQTATTRSFAKINEAVAVLQRNVEEAGANTAASRSAGEAQTQQLMILLDETRALASDTERHNKRLADLQGGNERLLAASEQGTAAVIRQRDIVQVMSEALQAANQQQEKRAAELIAALQSTSALLRELQGEQANQRNALQTVAERVERMSRPWWKKLF